MGRLAKIGNNVLFGIWGLWGVWLLWVGIRDRMADPQADLRIQLAMGALQILMALQFFQGERKKRGGGCGASGGSLSWRTSCWDPGGWIPRGGGS